MSDRVFSFETVRSIGKGLYFYGDMLAFSFVISLIGVVGLGLYATSVGRNVSLLDMATLTFIVLFIGSLVVLYGALKLKNVAQSIFDKLRRLKVGVLIYYVVGILDVITVAMILLYIRFINPSVTNQIFNSSTPAVVPLALLLAVVSAIYGIGTIFIALDLLEVVKAKSITNLGNWVHIMLLSGILQLLAPIDVLTEASSYYTLTVSTIGGMGGVLTFYSLIVIGGRLSKLSES
ncbi:MAG: hypothetical protein ACP6IS_06450 [Candidatus Asgardarchaeia archaeon]